jgi:predicted TIM-barrel fold metal-dependent hydrolase
MFHRSVDRRLDDNSLIGGRDWYKGQDTSEFNFRGGDFGKLLWTVDGVDYGRYYLPPTARNLDSPSEQIIAQMDYAGIDRALIQAGHTYGRLNEYQADVISRYTDRFLALVSVEEWSVDDSSQFQVLDRAVSDLGLNGLFFNTASFSHCGRSEKFDDPASYPFRDHVRDLGIPVFWDITTSDPGQEDWMEVHAAFGRW